MSTKKNVLANVGGRFSGAIMSFAFVPFYLKFMGIEAYGLIGFFTSLLGIFMILDMGLSTTVNRELARLSASADSRPDARDLTRTLETIYWSLSVLICVSVVALAPAIARHWLNIGTLPEEQAIRSVQLMGVTAMLRWPVSLYTGALMGMRRHVRLNMIIAFGALLQGGGAVIVLWLVSPTPVAFFAWQIFAALVQIVLLWSATWRQLLQQGHRAQFRVAALRPILAFSAGVTGITLLSVILTQLDKFVLSKLLPLDQFGYYALAGTIAATLTTASSAVYGAIFPSFAHLVAIDRLDDLRTLYHKSCQLLSIIIIPAGLVLALFSPELLQIYLHDPRAVANMSMLLSVFAIGNIFLAIMMPPLALQYAFGWTKLSLYKNVIAVLIFVPLLLVMVSRFGAVGAAVVWLILTSSYFILEIQVMHRRILRGAQWRWYLLDIGAPTAISLPIIGLARWLMPTGLPVLEALAVCVVAGGTALAASAIALPTPRAWIMTLLRSAKEKYGAA